jgi:hypothetical protein
MAHHYAKLDVVGMPAGGFWFTNPTKVGTPAKTINIGWCMNRLCRERNCLDEYASGNATTAQQKEKRQHE